MSDRPILWTGTLSPFSAKVRIALAEKGIDHEVREVSWTRAHKWGDKPAGLFEVNPRGEVPVWVEGDLALRDSTLICEYLEERHPAPALLPREAEARARCRMWEDEADSLLAGPVTVMINEIYLNPDGHGRDEAAVADARAALEEHYARLDAAVADREWLAGEGFSLADSANAILLLFAASTGAPPEGHGHLDIWLKRVQGRESFAREIPSILAAAATA